MKLFALNQTRYFGERVAVELGLPLASHEERDFEDGEHKARPLESVRDRDVFVIQSLHGGPDQSPDEKFCRLLFFLAAMHENGARHVTAVIPYLAYARKDRQTKTRDPVTTRYVAQLLEAAGADAIVTMDVHNIVAFQNAHRCQTIHLDTRQLFAERAIDLVADDKVVVASPDPGGVKRAQLFRETLEAGLGRAVGSAYMEKRRSAGVVSGSHLVGDLEGATVLVIDDMIASGGDDGTGSTGLQGARCQQDLCLCRSRPLRGKRLSCVGGPDHNAHLCDRYRAAVPAGLESRCDQPRDCQRGPVVRRGDPASASGWFTR